MAIGATGGGGDGDGGVEEAGGFILDPDGGIVPPEVVPRWQPAGDLGSQAVRDEAEGEGRKDGEVVEGREGGKGEGGGGGEGTGEGEGEGVGEEEEKEGEAAETVGEGVGEGVKDAAEEEGEASEGEGEGDADDGMVDGAGEGKEMKGEEVGVIRFMSVGLPLGGGRRFALRGEGLEMGAPLLLFLLLLSLPCTCCWEVVGVGGCWRLGRFC